MKGHEGEAAIEDSRFKISGQGVVLKLFNVSSQPVVLKFNNTIHTPKLSYMKQTGKCKGCIEGCIEGKLTATPHIRPITGASDDAEGLVWHALTYGGQHPFILKGGHSILYDVDC